MNIRNLYLVKRYFWLLFSTKETALLGSRPDGPYPFYTTATAADYWSKQYNYEVTYFSPDSIIIFLEEEGKFKKVLTSEGLIGWTWFTENFNDCFEEVKTK